MTTAQIDFSDANVIAELERKAYAENAPALAEVLAALHDALQRINELETQIDDTETLEQWERKNDPAESYKSFFYDCFERLNGHHPCISVTSDYDCGVIFDAIERGEEVRMHNENIRQQSKR